jgi:hypothetical protein
MTQIIGDATHFKGRALSGAIQSGENWVFDGNRYIPGMAGSEILADLSGRSGLVATSGDELAVVSGDAVSGAVLMWSGSDMVRDVYLDTQWKARLSADLKQVENSLAMVCWDLYSQDKNFSDIAIDDFEDQDGVDLFRSVAVFNSGDDCYTRVFSQSGASVDLLINSADRIDPPDLKGSIFNWVQDSGSYGHFEGKEKHFRKEAAIDKGSGLISLPCSSHGLFSGATVQIRGAVNYDGTHILPDQSEGDWANFIISGTYTGETFTGDETVSQRMTLGSGNDSPHVRPGLLAYSPAGNRVITSISGTGEGSAAVGMDSDLSGCPVTRITGVEYDSSGSGLTIKSYSGVTPSGVLIAKLTDQILLSAQAGPTVPWSVLESIQVTQTTPGTSTVHHAIRMGQEDIWKVFLNSGWNEIAIKDSGVWKYKNSSGQWAYPDRNEEMDALYSAISVTENQWGKTEIDAMSQAQWQSSGGFSSGDPVAFAVALEADGSNIPILEKYTVTRSMSDNDLALELKSWEASEHDPEEAYCVIDMENNASSAPWSSGTPGGEPRFRHTAAQASGKIYFWAGLNRGMEKLNSLDIYDISGDTWQSGASWGMARDKSAAVIYANKMYCHGGWTDDSGIVGDLNIYDIALNTWQSGPTCPDSRCCHTMELYNDKIYCWGGQAPSYDPINTMMVFDPVSSSWSSGLTGGAARMEHTAVIFSGKMYCWGGILANGQTTNSMDIYDFSTGLWISGRAGGSPRRGHCAVVVGNKMLCYGGAYGDSYLDTVDIYDFPSDSWLEGVNLGQTRFAPAAAEYSGKMIIWGGMNESATYNTTHIYDYSAEFDPASDMDAWLSIDDGANFQQFPPLKTFKRVNDRYYLRGDIYDVSGRGDNRVRLRVNGNNLSQLKIHGISTGVKYR